LLGNSGYTGADQPAFSHHTVKFMEENGHVLPIPAPGRWIVSSVLFLKFLPILPMFAIKFKTPVGDEDYFSIGIARWDDVDHYYDLLRVRAHGTKGRIVMVIFGLAVAASLYFGFFS